MVTPVMAEMEEKAEMEGKIPFSAFHRNIHGMVVTAVTAATVETVVMPEGEVLVFAVKYCCKMRILRQQTEWPGRQEPVAKVATQEAAESPEKEKQILQESLQIPGRALGEATESLARTELPENKNEKIRR